MASTSFGLMTMPSTPWVMAASMSAVCLGEETWPSLSITVIPPSFSASAFIWFIMWTKNGKVSPGTDSIIVRGLSSACAGNNSPNATLTAPAIASVLRITVIVLSSQRVRTLIWHPDCVNGPTTFPPALASARSSLALPHSDRSRRRRLFGRSSQGANSQVERQHLRRHASCQTCRPPFETFHTSVPCVGPSRNHDPQRSRLDVGVQEAANMP